MAWNFHGEGEGGAEGVGKGGLGCRAWCEPSVKSRQYHELHCGWLCVSYSGGAVEIDWVCNSPRKYSPAGCGDAMLSSHDCVRGSTVAAHSSHTCVTTLCPPNFQHLQQNATTTTKEAPKVEKPAAKVG